MTIYKKVSPWDSLNEFSSDDWDKVGDLVKYVLDNGLEAEFDKISEQEFTNGCEIEEFKEWCETDALEMVKDVKI